MFSSRVASELTPNRLTRALNDLRQRGVPYLDLTESNPTRSGFSYPPDLLKGLAGPAARTYRPEPFGLLSAREAVCRELARRGVATSPNRVVLTASTSEAYSFLFKLLCDSGDRVLVPRPSYPLFDHLTRLDDVVPVAYDLERHARWTVDLDGLERALDPGTRAILAVNPNNPTGSLLAEDELQQMADLCANRSLAFVGDEVFLDYPLASARVRSVLEQTGALTFSLGGLSKSAGLPQVKLAWMVIGGPDALVDQAAARLEVIADAYLSVATPVQEAAGELMDAGGQIRRQIQSRIEANLDELRRVAANRPSCEVLEPEAGWSVVLRVPAVVPEEALVVRLLEQDHVLVHPGYYFDFPREAYLVVSLLPEPDVFAQGIRRVIDRAEA